MYQVRWEKRLAAAVVGAVPHRLAQALQGLVVGRPFIRAVNYHATPAENRDQFRRHLEFYREHYCDVTYDDLCGLLEQGMWTKPKPGLLLSFDDGYRDNATVAAPLLEEFGFTGWFFVPACFAADGHDGTGGNQPPRPTMTIEQLRALAARHVVGSHTRTHCRLRESVGEERLRREIVDSKAELAALLGREVETFCWVGGEEDTYCEAAARFVKEAGYRFAFMTNSAPTTPRTHPLQIQRSNIETEYPLSLVKFQLAGLMDVLYAPKRRRVNAVTRHLV